VSRAPAGRSGGEALYVTLSVPDPVALTALAALRSLAGPAPAWLERGRVWLHTGGGAVFEAPAGVWLNPNKERGVRWTGGANPWTADAAGGGEAWVLVRERGACPEAGAARALAERGERPPAGLTCATLWRLGPPADPAARGAGGGGAADRVALAEAAAVVRSAHRGLLVNPHSQAHLSLAPPATLAELASRLDSLAREAQAGG